MNIVLVGYRGTGKSTIARILSRKLKRKLFSTDELIAGSAGMTIPDIVAEWGWPRFREIESRIVEEVTDGADGRVIDCGGGVVLEERNVRNLRENGRIVLLTASLETILKRTRRDVNRPPLKKGLTFEEEQKRVLEERLEKYNAVADMVCDTGKTPPGETAEKIIDYFKERGWI